MNPDLGMVVDVVDGRNRPISDANRRDLFERRLNFRTVHVLLLDAENNLILQRLAGNHPRSPNKIGSSVAGYLHSGESYFAAAKRKLRSELDVTARIRDFGHFKMADQESVKFVHVYRGRLRSKPTIKDQMVEELVRMSEIDLADAMERDPSIFTPTFVVLYQHYRRWTHGS